MIDVDLRPASVVQWMEGVDRVRLLQRNLKKFTCGVLSLLISLAYLKFSHARLDRQVIEYRAALERLAAQELEARRAADSDVRRRLLSEKGQQHTAQLEALFTLLERLQAARISFSEIRAQFNTISMRGEVDEASTLYEFGSQLASEMKNTAFTIDALRNTSAQEIGHYSQFSARVSFGALGSEGVM